MRRLAHAFVVAEPGLAVSGLAADEGADDGSGVVFAGPVVVGSVELRELAWQW